MNPRIIILDPSWGSTKLISFFIRAFLPSQSSPNSLKDYLKPIQRLTRRKKWTPESSSLIQVWVSPNWQVFSSEHFCNLNRLHNRLQIVLKTIWGLSEDYLKTVEYFLIILLNNKDLIYVDWFSMCLLCYMGSFIKEQRKFVHLT